MPQLTIEQVFDLAVQRHQAGRLREAEQLYRQILARQPEHAGCLHLLGVIAHQVGRDEIAIQLIRQALALMPHYPEANSNLGNALRGNGQLDQAIAAFRRALDLKPDFADAHSNLGNALRDKGQLDEAIAAYRKALSLIPKSSEALCNLGNALRDKGQFDEVVAIHRQALALNPNLAEGYNNLAGVLRDKGQLDEAIVHYRQALAIKPGYVDACNNLGHALNEQGRLDEALDAYRRAVGLNPDLADTHSSLIFAMHYHPGYDDAAIGEELRLWDQRHALALLQGIAPHSNDRSPNRRIKVGYLSHDLCLHSVAFFLLPLLEQHDKTRFHITCYATGIHNDHATGRLRACADEWRSLVGLSDSQAAELIRRDEIDILVDLGGHTAGNRLLVLARKPAPVQVTYLGFPGNTGLQTIDYRLTDAYADPPSEDVNAPARASAHASEELVRLPETAWCFTPLSGSPAVGDLPALRNGHVTFGSFNNLAKVTLPTVELWSELLKSVPNSRLILKSVAFGGTETADRFRRMFAERGIDPGWIELMERQPSQLRHLELYNRIDIGLDTFPYHGTTTTCEALWMGVSVVTLAGQRHAARVGVSLLTNLGLGELIADTPEQYLQIAQALANDLPKLSQLRSTLRQRMERSPIMDAKRFARQVEHAYREMWRKWCAGV